MPETFVVTHIKNGAADLARHLKECGYSDVHVVRKTNVTCVGESKPWSVLSGYMTNDTQVVPVSGSKESIDNAIARYG